MFPLYTPGFCKPDALDRAEISWISVTSVRDECFMAERTISYTYGKMPRTYTSVPYAPEVRELQNNLNDSGLTYNVCFLNRYNNERQALGWHADDSPEMDPNHPIAVISFGETREIWWRLKGTKEVAGTQLLEPGSLFVMPAGFQGIYEHRIPKGSRRMMPRISLTFRHYTTEVSS